jgi:diacylglycerol kinase family enzyme
VSNIFTGRVTAVDVGEVNRIFLNNSSLGIYPEVVRMREEEQRHGQGKWAASARLVAACATTQLHIRLRRGEGW